MSPISSIITEGIEVSVRTAYMQAESSPRHFYYAFAYQIDITNLGEGVVQLLSREWLITDAFGRTETVRGEGVVGRQPFIKPEETYSYTSGTHFQTPVGKMEGFYLMVRVDSGERLRVRIPAFTMMLPELYN